MNKLVALLPQQGVQNMGNLYDSYMKGQQNTRQNALLDIQQAQNERAAQTHEQTLRGQELNNQGAEFQLDQAQGAKLYKALSSLASVKDPEMRAAQIEFMAPGLEKVGFDAEDFEMLSTDEGLQEGIQILSRFASKENAAPSQFGAQATFKDEDNNLFFGTTRRNPTTGEVESVLAPIGDGPKTPVGKVSQTGSFGLTAEEDTKKGALDKSAEVTAANNAEARTKIIEQGNAARSMLRTTDKLLELNEAITTGKTAKARKFFGDVFGVTDPDLGQFNALAGKLVLDNIRALGANPTEGERAFLLQITPSIEQGGAVNEAILKDMREVQKRQLERARWMVKNPDKTVEEYLLLNDDFEASATVTSPTSSGGTVKWGDL